MRATASCRRLLANSAASLRSNRAWQYVPLMIAWYCDWNSRETRSVMTRIAAVRNAATHISSSRLDGMSVRPAFRMLFWTSKTSFVESSCSFRVSRISFQERILFLTASSTSAASILCRPPLQQENRLDVSRHRYQSYLGSSQRHSPQMQSAQAFCVLGYRIACRPSPTRPSTSSTWRASRT